MKIHIYRKLVFMVMSLILISACTDGFEELNTDPNQPLEVPTSSLISGAERELVRSIFGNHEELVGIGLSASIFTQQISNLRGAFDDIYATVEYDFSDFYIRGLRDLEEVIILNTNEETKAEAAKSGPNENQIAVAMILKAWAFHNITDVWGDIPYSQALSGSDFPLPVYDTQEDIYLDLLSELTAASAMIDVSAGDIEGDIIYAGNMSKWQLFANSLKMRIGLRLSKVAPGIASVAVAEAFNAGVFTSNDDNAKYEYLPSAPNYNPWYFRFELSVPNYGVGSTLIDMLKGFNDPRLEMYADTAFNQDLGGGFVGNPVGYDRAAGSAISDFAVSWPDAENVLGQTTPFTIMTYSEVLFVLAEAAERGWITGTVKDYYQMAITASIEQWGVTDPTTIADYLAQPSVTLDATNPIKSIGDQKYIALYMQGVQTWSEWRRLGYPELEIARDAVIAGMPRRRGYPPSEITLNKDNYDIAVSRQGVDDLLTRMWWDL